ncbi:hypothetical protein SAMN04244548_03006 [Paracoccus pantotrophus]|nr:hypothetical protein SAMN04244548_03006 [Paracoccus pantotrophus]
MSLTVPRAPTIGGRAAQLRFEDDQTGHIVARFGMTMMQVGEHIAAEQEQRGLGKARVAIAQRLNDLQLQGQQIGDPDELDQFGTAEFQRARQETIDTAPAGIRDQVGQMFDEQALPHKARLGGRGLELRHSQELANLSSLGDEVVRTVAIADPATQASARAQYEAHLDNLVQRGVLAPDQAERARQQMGGQMESARAQRMLSENPEALVAAVDEGEFSVLGAEEAQNWRARGLAAAKSNAARGLAEDKRARSEQISSARDFLNDGISVLRKGQPFAGATDAVALMQDPEIARLPEAREYVATVQLTQERPELAVLPLADKRQLLADLEKRAISKPYEADKVDALRKMIAADEKGFREDPLTYAATIGLKPAPDLPDPATADSADLVAGLRSRRQYAASLGQSGYTDDPKFFTPEEREAWSRLSDAAASPETRARLAQDLAAALGPQAEDAAAELEADPVFTLVGGGLAHGLSPLTARQIFEGQRVIEGQQVKLPAKAERRQSFFGEFDSLFFDGTVEGWPDQAGVRDQITSAADALYAYRMRSAEAEGSGKDGQIEEKAYLQAVHEVMGGLGKYDSSKARGGVQEVRDQLTILPAGISASDVEDRLDLLAAGGADLWSRIAVGGGKPSAGGEMPDARSIGRMRLRAVGPDQYVMVWPNRSTGAQTVLMRDDGGPFVISMQALMQLGQAK